MASDTKYVSKPFLYTSKGIVARPIIDRVPDGFYLSLFNCSEQEEGAMSARYGSSIINRDAINSNFFSPGQINTISRLKGLNSQVWRYYQSLTSLYRRAGNAPGQYNLIYTGLSGSAFSTVVAPTFASGTPYLFIWDSLVSIKDIGTGTPVRTGILPPTQVANALVYAPQVTVIDGFNVSRSGYSPSGLTLDLIGSIYAITGGSGFPVLVNNYEDYFCPDGSCALAQNNMLVVNLAGQLNQIFQIQQDTLWFSINPLGNALPANTNFFAVGGVTSSFGVAASSTGTIGKAFSFNFGSADPNDLFILSFAIQNPASIQEIRLQFDINNGGYSKSYYYKSIAPPSYQSGISLPGTTSPSTAVNDEIFSRAGGVTNLSQVNSPSGHNATVHELPPEAIDDG